MHGQTEQTGVASFAPQECGCWLFRQVIFKPAVSAFLERRMPYVVSSLIYEMNVGVVEILLSGFFLNRTPSNRVCKLCISSASLKKKNLSSHDLWSHWLRASTIVASFHFKVEVAVVVTHLGQLPSGASAAAAPLTTCLCFVGRSTLPGTSRCSAWVLFEKFMPNERMKMHGVVLQKIPHGNCPRSSK